MKKQFMAVLAALCAMPAMAQIDGFLLGINAGQLEYKRDREYYRHPGVGVELQYIWRNWFVSAQGFGAMGDDDDDTLEIAVDKATSAIVGVHGYIDDRVMLQVGVGWGGASITETTIATATEETESFDGLALRVRGMEAVGESRKWIFSVDYTLFAEDDGGLLDLRASGVSLGMHRQF